MRAAGVLCLAVVVLGAYGGVLKNGFIWDDRIALNNQLRHFDTIASLFFPPRDLSDYQSQYYRPLILATYKLDDALARAFWPATRLEAGRRATFHASGLAAHWAAASLLFLLGLELFRGRAGGEFAAFFAALLFALHPVHVESVAWMAGRSDVFAALFAIGALWCYATHRRAGGGALLWAAGALALLAFLAKEVALALVLVPPLLDIAISPSAPAPPRWRRWAPFGAALGLYLALRFASGAPGPPGLWRLGNLPGAVGWSVLKILWPWPQQVFVPDVPGGAIAVLGVAAMLVIVAGFFLLLRRGGPAAGLVGLGLFAATLAPSIVVALRGSAKTPLAERYLYLPSAGACLLVAAVIRCVTSRVSAALLRRFLQALLVIAAGAASIVTVQAWVSAWSDDLIFWTRAAATAPNHATPHLMLGSALADAGRPMDALQEDLAAESLSVEPEAKARALNNIAAALVALKRYAAAAPYARDAVQLAPNMAQAHHNLAVAILFDQEIRREGPEWRRLQDEAQAHLQQAVALDPSYYQALHLLAVLLLERGHEAEGKAYLRRVLELAPDSREGQSAKRLLSQM